jgi:hypothetical protein
VEALKIGWLCVLAAVLFGVLLDLVTAFVCIQYFTAYHGHRFSSESPWAQGLSWGLFDFWWRGAILGLVAATLSRWTSLPKLTWTNLSWPLVAVAAATYIASFVSGVTAFYLIRDTPLKVLKNAPQVIDAHLSADQERGFTADLYAHVAGQWTMLACAILLCLWIVKKRIKLRRLPPPPII